MHCERNVLLLVLLTLLMLLTACSSNWERSNTREFTARWMERNLLICKSTKIDALIAPVSKRVADAILFLPPSRRRAIPSIAVTVFRDSRPLALSLPRGEIFISSGLIALLQTEGELAAALSHETSHLILDHHGLYGRDFSSEPKVSYDLKLEHEADELAATLTRLAGYPSQSSIYALTRTSRAIGESVSEKEKRDLATRASYLSYLLGGHRLQKQPIPPESIQRFQQLKQEIDFLQNTKAASCSRQSQ